MFNKLVVSTNERRKGRIAKYFCGTAITYALVIAGVLALSVAVSNPRLADTGERMLALLTPPPPPGPPRSKPKNEKAPPPPERRFKAAPAADLNRVMAAPTPVRRPPEAAQLPALDAGDTVAGGVAEGQVDFVPGGQGRGETVAPPPPRVADPPGLTPKPRADLSRPVRLTSTVLQGKAVVRRTPAYPALARQARIFGSVSVEVMIAPDGHVETARAINGHPTLAKTAVDAAYEWRFEPTLLNGTPVRVSGVIVFNFTLQ